MLSFWLGVKSGNIVLRKLKEERVPRNGIVNIAYYFWELKLDEAC